jgi:hypothetical protein
LELDYGWILAQRIDINKLMRVGSIQLQSPQTVGWKFDDYAVLSKAQVHTYVMGWKQWFHFETDPICDLGASGEVKPPRQWDHTEHLFQHEPHPQPEDQWKWNPRCPSNSACGSNEEILQDGQYVRVVGALVTDDPHWDTRETIHGHPGPLKFPVNKLWGDYIWKYGVQPKEEATNDTRWTELHPIDVIERIPCPFTSEESSENTCDPDHAPYVVRSLALIANSGLTRAFGFQMPAPANRPPNSWLNVNPIIDSSNTTLNKVVGHTITKFISSDGRPMVHVWVAIRSYWWRATFKATYVAWWVRLH